MKKILIIVLSVLILIIVAGVIFVKVGTTAVNKKDNHEIRVTIDRGDSRTTVAKKLADAGLVKNKLAAILYININRSKNIYSATYAFNKTMSLNQILTKINKQEKVDDRVIINLKFVPGKRITSYAETIAEFVNEYQDPVVEVTKDDIINEINDKEYVKTLIDKYWFLTDEVLDGEIFYALEGYLQPETYQFYTTSTVKEIIERMLDQTNKKLTPLKEDIKKSGYTVHEILSAAAIIEKEANSEKKKKKVAQVIYTRIAKKMNLGMDVTAYYAAKVEQTKDNPYMYAWNFLPSKYNTRNKDNLGLPIGPICNPSLSSINAALNPSDTNYLYFYADINTGKVYFAEDYAGFMKIQKDLGV